jgi:hypothetical protein
MKGREEKKKEIFQGNNYENSPRRKDYSRESLPLQKKPIVKIIDSDNPKTPHICVENNDTLPSSPANHRNQDIDLVDPEPKEDHKKAFVSMMETSPK